MDAPGIIDDFYMNLLDWSCSNLVAIALGNTVYLWDASDGSTSELLSVDDDIGPVTSVRWAPDGRHIAVGFNNSHVQLWDSLATRLVCSFLYILNYIYTLNSIKLKCFLIFLSNLVLLDLLVVLMEANMNCLLLFVFSSEFMVTIRSKLNEFGLFSLLTSTFSCLLVSTQSSVFSSIYYTVKNPSRRTPVKGRFT